MIDRRQFLQQVAAGAAVAGSSLAEAAHADADEILVGGLHDLSGPLDSAGKPMHQMLQFAIADINEAGGLLDRKVRLIAPDTQTNMQLYSSLTQELVLKDRVCVVMGGITSASREIIRPLLDRLKTLYFYNTLYEGGVCDRNTFCTATTPGQTVEKLVSYATKTWGKKIYIVAADYNYGRISAGWIKKFAAQSGADVIAADFFPLDVTSFGPTIAKIQAAKPDAVMSLLVGAAHLGFYRQWAAAGLKSSIPIASTTFGGAGTELTILTPEEANGIVTCVGYYDTIGTEANRAFRARVEAKLGKPPTGPTLTEVSVCTYEACMMWADAVKRAGSLDRMKVIEALETPKGFEFPTGKVVIDPKTHHTTRNVYLGVVKDRQFAILETYPQQAPVDVQAVCDLAKNPNDHQQYQIKL